MPVPNSIQDLSTDPNSNYPVGSEAIGNSLDNYMRAGFSFTRQFYSLASAGIAAASTVNVASADGESVEITGTGTINSLGAGYVGCKRELRFADVCTIKHSADINLPGGEDIETAALDAYTFRCVASGQWIYVCGSTAGGADELFEPPVILNANTTLNADHLRKQLEKTGSGAFTWTIAPNLGAAGDPILLSNNNDSGNLIIARGSGVALWRYGANANVTIPPRRVMVIRRTTVANVWQSL